MTERNKVIKKDLTGQRFGKLTVLEKTDKTENNYRLWRCACDCGGEILVNTKHLKNGIVTNCGCIPKTNARRGNVAEDLTGQTFGYLTVIKRAENRHGRTNWLCCCECGKLKKVTAHDLKAGKVKSCGCHKYDHGYNTVDLTGQRFGRLIAMYPLKKRDSKGSVYWKCQCDCGNEAEATESSLVHGNVRSCGCLKSENQKKIKDKLHRIDGTCVEILEKRKYRKDNTSGFRGVFQLKSGKYRVDIGFKGHKYYIGTYEDYNEAVQARLEAEGKIYEGFLNAYYKWKERADKDPKWASNHPLVFDVSKKMGQLVINSSSEYYL